MLRGLVKRGGGHRSIMRIGPAGENGSAMACINADTYRHFGRLGGGAVMGGKNLKAIVIEGDASFALPESKDYPKVFQEAYTKVTGKDMMKYHDIGTPINMAVAERDKDAAHPQSPEDDRPGHEQYYGRTVRGADAAPELPPALAVPVGCIHIGFVRERFRRNTATSTGRFPTTTNRSLPWGQCSQSRIVSRCSRSLTWLKRWGSM